MRRLTLSLFALMMAGCAASGSRPSGPLPNLDELHASLRAPAPRSLLSRGRTAATRASISAEAASEDSELSLVFRQQGACSWYGPRFHGRRTSSGEIFDKHELTAAHRSLPFGSQVEVTDVKTGKKVRVRINDRGPYRRQRIIDLSYAAAARLDILGRGVADVELRLVDIDDAVWPEGLYALQAGTFSSQEAAEAFLARMSPAQRAASLYYVKAPEEGSGSYRVRFGPFSCEDSARSAMAKLQSVGVRTSLVREAPAPGGRDVAASDDTGAKLIR